MFAAALLSGNAKLAAFAAMIVFILAFIEGVLPRRDRYYTPSLVALGLALLAVAFIVNG